MKEINQKKIAIYAKSTKILNHAISIVVDKVGGGFLYDNGCKKNIQHSEHSKSHGRC